MATQLTALPASNDDDRARASALDAPIRAVELFRSGALVHRDAELPTTSDGTLHLMIDELPLGLVDGSVRAELLPAGDCRVIDLQVALQVRTPVEDRQVDEIERVRTLRRQIAELGATRARLKRQAAELTALRPLLPPPPHRPDYQRFTVEDPVAAWLALGQLGRERGAAQLSQVRELEQRLRELHDQLKAAEDAQQQLSGAQRRRLEIGKRVELRLAGRFDAGMRLRLSYLVPGARWYPSYELRVDPAAGDRAELVFNAMVAQVTGEDWSQVELSLCTADLARQNALPRLPAWRIGRAQDRDEARAWRPLPDDLPQLFADYDRKRPERPAAPPPRESLRSPLKDISTVEQYLQQDDQTPLYRGDPTEEDELPTGAGAQLFADEPTKEYATTRSGVAAPPPAIRPAPGPAYPGGAAPEPALARAAPEPDRAPARSRRMAKKLDRRSELEGGLAGSYGGGGGEREQPPGAVGTPDAELLSYGNLLLRGADDDARGTLQARARHEAIPAAQREQGHDALAGAEGALRSALLELHAARLPGGARDVGESAGHFAYRYRGRAAIDVPADGQMHRVGVLRQAMPLSLLHRTVPATDPEVYRLALLENTLAQPLLAGPLDVFWGNDFLVTAQLSTTAVGASIEANLGVEPRIKVARNTRHSEHEAGLLQGKTVYEEQVEIEIDSGLAQACTLEIFERIPVTDERKLEIKTLAEDPPGEPYDQRDRKHPIRGGRRFRLELEPRGKRRCSLSYRMTLPGNSEIAGGGRRA